MSHCVWRYVDSCSFVAIVLLIAFCVLMYDTATASPSSIVSDSGESVWYVLTVIGKRRSSPYGTAATTAESPQRNLSNCADVSDRSTALTVRCMRSNWSDASHFCALDSRFCGTV